VLRQPDHRAEPPVGPSPARTTGQQSNRSLTARCRARSDHQIVRRSDVIRAAHRTLHSVTTSPTPEDVARFTRIYRDTASRVYLYAARQVSASDAEDVVAETFVTAWRRLEKVPEAPLPWLLVVARNTIANLRRSRVRRDRAMLEADRHARLNLLAEDVEDEILDRAFLLAQLAELTDREREALLLVAWDGLSNADAAIVAGCSTRTFSVRLHRARTRLGHPTTEPPAERTLPTTELSPEATP
jgi:RNA polymerase sigma factor (sigma-70 family)